MNDDAYRAAVQTAAQELDSRRLGPRGRRSAGDGGAGPDGTRARHVADLTEDGLALALVEQWPYSRWVDAWGRWMLFDGRCWREDSTLTVYDRVRAVCREMAAMMRSDDVARRLRKGSTIAAVERLAKADRAYAGTVDQWDADPWVLNTPGGVVDLRTGEVRNHEPEDYATKITAIAPGGDCPLWLRVLDDITGGDADLMAFLQRLAGYALTGSTREHALAFLYGTGANGKGTFLNTLRGVLDGYATVAPIEAFTEAATDRHPTELAMLRGARLVVAQETESGRRWAESRLKAITGGDPIAARFMRQDFFEYVPTFKLMIAGNHKPNLRNVDEAIRRRLLLVPFTVTIPAERRDPDLAEKLRAEWPGILAWAIAGCRAYLERRLDPPAAVLNATRAYFAAEDTFAAWVEDCCDRGPSKWERPRVLFQSWQAWADANGYAAGNQKAFAAAMEAHGFEAGKDGHHGGRYWRGIAVRPPEAEHPR